MDLVKARERAKKKAGKKKKRTRAKKASPAKKKARSKKEREKESRLETTAPAAVQEEIFPTAPEPVTDKGAATESPPTKKTEKEKMPLPPEKPEGEKKEEAPAGKKEPPSLPFELDTDDVFEDFAFGEDLPLTGKERKPSADLVLGEEGLSGPQAAGEKKAPEKRPGVKKTGPGRREGPGESADTSEKELMPAPEPPAKDWQVSEPAAATPAPARIEMEWEDQEPTWSLDDLTTRDKDFFTLVTEDLYMREFGKQAEDDLSHKLELLSFRLAHETYAVRLTSIRQIIKLVPITMVPRAPDYVLGIISLRGNIIPIFDLRRRLRLPAASPSRKSRIIVVAENDFMVGLIVDQVEQVVRIPEAEIEPPPPVLAGVEAEYIEGIGRSGKKMIIVFALEKILLPVILTKG